VSSPLKREQIVAVFLFLALGGILYLVAELLLPYTAPVAWAAILAVVFFPLYRLLLGVLPSWSARESLAAGIMTVLVFCAVVVPSLLLSGVIAREAVEGYQHLAAFVSSGRLAELNRVVEWWPIAPVWDWVQKHMETGDVNPTKFLLSGVRWGSEVVARSSGAIARNVLSFFVGLAIMLFTLFFAFRDGRQILANAEQSLPMAPDDRQRLFDRLRQTILAVVQGITVTAAVQGALVAIGLTLVGMPFAVLLGTATFFLAFLPIGGAALVWIPTVVGMVIAGEWVRGAIFGIYSMLTVSSVDNIIKPMVIGSQAQLSTPILFFGILGGLQTYGVLGLFLGPVILSTFAVLLHIYREQYLS